MTRRTHIMLLVLGGALLLPGLWTYLRYDAQQRLTIVGSRPGTSISTDAPMPAVFGSRSDAQADLANALMSCAGDLFTPARPSSPTGTALWCAEGDGGPQCAPALPPGAAAELGHGVYALCASPTPLAERSLRVGALVGVPAVPSAAVAGAARPAYLARLDRPPRA